MTTDIQQFILGSGVKSFSFAAIGDTVRGTIESLELQQQRDFKTNEPLWWDPDTKQQPKMHLRVVLQTELRDEEDDDGRRGVYIKGQMQQAVRDAIKKAGANQIKEGGTLAVKFDAEGKAPKEGLNKPKIYSAAYKPPEEQPAAVAVDDLI